MKKQLLSVLAAGMVMSSAIMNVQAQTKSIWVLTQHNGIRSHTMLKKHFSYDKNGLIKKEKVTYEGSGVFEYVYDAKGHIRQIRNANSKAICTKYVTNKKGLVTKSHSNDNFNPNTTYAYNKKGLMTLSKDAYVTDHYKYNRKGQLIANHADKIIKYDKYGYRINCYDHDSYKNKYNKHHLLISATWTKHNFYGSQPDSYKYKKIRINTKYATEIKRQQDALTGKNGYILAYISND